jgi:hypothetical protein
MLGRFCFSEREDPRDSLGEGVSLYSLESKSKEVRYSNRSIHPSILPPPMDV